MKESRFTLQVLIVLFISLRPTHAHCAPESKTQNEADARRRSYIERHNPRSTASDSIALERQQKIDQGYTDAARKDPSIMYDDIICGKYGLHGGEMIHFAPCGSSEAGSWRSTYHYKVIQIADSSNVLLAVSVHNQIDGRAPYTANLPSVVASIPDTSGFIDGDTFPFTNMVRVGRYQYVDTDGAIATVAKYVSAPPISSAEFAQYISTNSNGLDELIRDYITEQNVKQYRK